MIDNFHQMAARTVVDLSDHMSHLRHEAQQLQAAFQTRERGYFTPAEDEQVLHLWVSYHKSRAALLDLIDTIRQSAGKATQDNTDDFLIAYAAAIVLVDAARSLRELFGDNQLVRSKLNESLLPYGIEADSFDAIQMSLTDPTNAVRLNQATQFFDQHDALIRQTAASSPSLGEVLNVVDRLKSRVQVSSRRYLKAMAAERSREVATRVGDGVGQAVYLIQELGSRVVSNITTIPNHVPRLPDPVQSQLIGMLEPGDVLVTRKENALTNYFLPGYWPHAALYIGDRSVIEALKDGVRLRTMESPMGNDAVAVIRPRLGRDQIDIAIERARTHIGKPYDFDFDFTRGDRLVCTEVVYRSYDGLEGMHLSLSRRVGRQTLSAEDLLGLAMRSEHFDRVAVYCPKHSDRLLVDAEMLTVLEKTVVGS